MTDRNCERKVPHWGPEQRTKCPLFLYNSCRQRLGSQLAALSLPLSLPLQPHLSGCTPACLGTSSICSLGSCYLGPSQNGTGKITVGGKWPSTIWSGPHSPLGWLWSRGWVEIHCGEVGARQDPGDASYTGVTETASSGLHVSARKSATLQEMCPLLPFSPAHGSYRVGQRGRTVVVWTIIQ